MRVQRGVPATFPVPTQRAHANTTGAARHSIGTSSGLHPEDHPYQTDERRPINRQPVYAEEEDDDRLLRKHNRYPCTKAGDGHTPLSTLVSPCW
jgi:hypothetical protein